MKHKHILKIDMALVIVSVLGLIVLVGYVSPMVIFPIDDLETSETSILFEIDKADKLFIDDNFDFTSPDEYIIEDGLKINLKPGIYYWKATGVLDSEIRTLTIQSEVNLKLKRLGSGKEGKNGDEKYGVFNAGNVKLDVDVYNGTELVDKIKLDVGEETSLEGDSYIGGMENE